MRVLPDVPLRMQLSAWLSGECLARVAYWGRPTGLSTDAKCHGGLNSVLLLLGADKLDLRFQCC